MKNISIVLFLATLIFMTSCAKDPIVESQNAAAPSLPAMESYMMPFDGFEDADTSDLAPGASGARNFDTHFHWFYSVSNIVLWNTVVTLNMVIPVKAFAEAFNQDPEFQGNGIWLWAYSYNESNKTYNVELTGQFVNTTEVQWDMYISQKNGFSKIHWFTGTIATDGSKGKWTLNFQPDTPAPYLSIDYQDNAAGAPGHIRFTNINETSADRGDYIEYREYDDNSVEFDRGYDVYRAQDDNLLQIEWNHADDAGRVKDPKQFNNSNWHCWDTDFVDVDC
jgi:hypothetical protein